jgi:hypothetical protein
VSLSVMSTSGAFGSGRVIIPNVEAKRRELLAAEDTNNDGKITVDDEGPKVNFFIHTPH